MVEAFGSVSRHQQRGLLILDMQKSNQGEANRAAPVSHTNHHSGLKLQIPPLLYLLSSHTPNAPAGNPSFCRKSTNKCFHYIKHKPEKSVLKCLVVNKGASLVTLKATTWISCFKCFLTLQIITGLLSG